MPSQGRIQPTILHQAGLIVLAYGRLILSISWGTEGSAPSPSGEATAQPRSTAWGSKQKRVIVYGSSC